MTQMAYSGGDGYLPRHNGEIRYEQRAPTRLGDLLVNEPPSGMELPSFVPLSLSPPLSPHSFWLTPLPRRRDKAARTHPGAPEAHPWRAFWLRDKGVLGEHIACTRPSRGQQPLLDSQEPTFSSPLAPHHATPHLKRSDMPLTISPAALGGMGVGIPMQSGGYISRGISPAVYSTRGLGVNDSVTASGFVSRGVVNEGAAAQSMDMYHDPHEVRAVIVPVAEPCVAGRIGHRDRPKTKSPRLASPPTPPSLPR